MAVVSVFIVSLLTFSYWSNAGARANALAKQRGVQERLYVLKTKRYARERKEIKDRIEHLEKENAKVIFHY